MKGASAQFRSFVDNSGSPASFRHPARAVDKLPRRATPVFPVPYPPRPLASPCHRAIPPIGGICPRIPTPLIPPAPNQPPAPPKFCLDKHTKRTHFRRQPSRSKPLAGCQTNRFLPPRGRPAARLKSALAVRAAYARRYPPGGRPAARPSCPPALARPTRLSCRPAPGPDLAVLPDRAGSAPAFLPTRPRLPTRPPGPPAPGASEPGPLAIARPPPPMPPPIFGLAVRLGPPVY